VDRVELMAVQSETRARIVFVPLDAEDAAALGLQDALGDQLVDPSALGERGVQADARLRPEQALGQVLVDTFLNPMVANRDEARDVCRVIGDETIAELEYVH
jgi:hypothetical protein